MIAFRITERDVTIVRRVWLSGWLIQSVLTPLLFLAAMGVGLGGEIDKRGAVEGVSYLQFVTPGLLCASVMQQAAGESMWPVLGGVKWDHRYLAMVSTPLAPHDVQTAQLVWVAIRGAATSVGFLLVAAALGGLASPWAVLALPAATVTGVAFAAWLAGLAIRQENDNALSLVYRLGIMPVFLFSGTFFPVSVLPPALRPLAWISPLWHGVELARHATLGEARAADLLHVIVLAAVIVAGAAWARRGFRRRLAP